MATAPQSPSVRTPDERELSGYVRWLEQRAFDAERNDTQNLRQVAEWLSLLYGRVQQLEAELEALTTTTAKRSSPEVES